MIYLSLDLETTGINPEKHQILSIGAIIEDTDNLLSFNEIPKLHIAIIRDKDEDIIGSTFALNMNKTLIEYINAYQEAITEDAKKNIENLSGLKFYHEDDAILKLIRFLEDNGFMHDNIIAGKNVKGFDIPFLQKNKLFNKYIKPHYRTLDPTHYFINWKSDFVPPSLSQCKNRAGLNSIVSHNAVEDAWDIITLFRTQY